MRPFILMSAFCGLVLGCKPSTGERQPFKTFDKTVEEGYHAAMPGTPQFRVSNYFNPTNVYYVDAPGIRYETHSAKVLVVGVPSNEPPKDADVAKMLRNSRDKYLKDIGGTEVYTNDVYLDSARGIEFMAKITDPPDGVLKGRIYHLDLRIYGAIAMGERAEVNGPDASTFFDSFKITAASKTTTKPKKK